MIDDAMIGTRATRVDYLRRKQICAAVCGAFTRAGAPVAAPARVWNGPLATMVAGRAGDAALAV
ncbi:hypothetical protein [Burkholderia vietnamiensis]|uniref:hypothetical protein n=1 Tax=Burkholderia vietnamiensis TaxID=60552 RepID=UPI0012DB7408|nr:hypothetical protein [Burkholderia vietnamiensis]